MKYLKELSSLKMFNKKDVISVCGNIHNANYVLKSYIDKGYITKINNLIIVNIKFYYRYFCELFFSESWQTHSSVCF